VNFPDTLPIIEYNHHLRSRYGETDRMGYVYYARYLEYFEVSRTEMIRAQGLSYREMEDSGVMLPVIHSQIEYKKPIIYDEEMQIKVMVFEKPLYRLETFYEVKTEGSEEVHALGEVTLCFVDKEKRKPCLAPKAFIDGMLNNASK